MDERTMRTRKSKGKGVKCAISTCKNGRYSANISGKILSFHVFPKNKQIRNVWIAKCKRNGDWKVDGSKICSDHFTDEDYVRDLKAELLGCKAKRFLKEGAIPSKNLPGTRVLTASMNARARRAAIKKEKEEHDRIISELLKESEPSASKPSTSRETCSITSENISLLPTCLESVTLIPTSTSSQAVEQSIPKISSVRTQTEPNYKMLYYQQLEKTKTLVEKLAKTEKLIEENRKFLHLIQGLFTQRQLEMLLKEKKRVRKWDDGCLYHLKQ